MRKSPEFFKARRKNLTLLTLRRFFELFDAFAQLENQLLQAFKFLDIAKRAFVFVDKMTEKRKRVFNIGGGFGQIFCGFSNIGRGKFQILADRREMNKLLAVAAVSVDVVRLEFDTFHFAFLIS